MSNPQQPGGWWSDPTSGPSYVDPTTGQPAQPGSPGPYPGQGAYPPGQAGFAGYGAYPGYPPPVAAPPSTNGMAIASLVLALCGLASCGVTSLVGAILGHVARRQIRERGEGGDGIALAGIVSGWIIFALAVVGFGAYIAFMVWFVRNVHTVPNPYPTS